MSNALCKIKLEDAELWKQKVTVTIIAVGTMKFLFGMNDCTVDSDVGMGYFSIMLGIWQLFWYMYVQPHMPPGKNCSVCN